MRLIVSLGLVLIIFWGYGCGTGSRLVLIVEDGVDEGTVTGGGVEGRSMVRTTPTPGSGFFNSGGAGI